MTSKPAQHKKQNPFLGIGLLVLRGLSAVILTLENATRSFWRAGVWVMLFFALWLFQIPLLFPFFVQIFVCLLFFVGAGFLAWKDAGSFRLPTRRDIDRRIEIDSDVKGRPLSQHNDSLANAERKETRLLWRIARVRLAARLPRLKPARLRSFMARRDPYALRLGIIMAFGLGLLTAGAEWRGRIIHGAMPIMPFELGGEAAERYTVWISPPDYTGLPQLVLNRNTIQGETIEIAQGSSIKAIVNGGFGMPSLNIGDERYDFEAQDHGSYGITHGIGHQDGKLVLRQGLLPVAAYDFALIPDVPPSIEAISNAAEILDNGEIRFDLSVYDDYGVEAIEMKMRLDPIVEDAPTGDDISQGRLISSPAKSAFQITPLYDLTSHPWAGLPVIFEFSAQDQSAQSSQSITVPMILPERDFKHPVAKTVVAMRKKLAWEPESAPLYSNLAHNLQILLMADDLFHNDTAVYLGIRAASSRLRYNLPSIETSRAVMRLLWDIALRVEDGDLSIAARRLRDAQMALEEALDDPNITNEDIARRMQDLRAAMAEYFAELAREMQKRQADGSEKSQQLINPEMMSQMMNAEALQDFLDQMEEAMKSGDSASAQDMLSKMRRLMEMLNPSNPQGGMPQDMQAMQEAVNELELLIERQKDLLAQTLEQKAIVDAMERYNIMPKMDDDNGAPMPLVDTRGQHAEQEALRIILGQLMLEASEMIGKIPETMGLAEGEMRVASAALLENAPQNATAAQEMAIKYLEQAQEQLAQQFQLRMAQMTGFMIGGSGQQQYDPFGRPMGGEQSPNGSGSGSQVKIPDEAERRRVQEILKTLRRRAGQNDRSREEIEYYRRLLKRF